jgi:hypothetical protein
VNREFLGKFAATLRSVSLGPVTQNGDTGQRPCNAGRTTPKLSPKLVDRLCSDEMVNKNGGDPLAAPAITARQ